jgi:predicted O-linked N-acetylglucosamine transferase (SPINDLY family)
MVQPPDAPDPVLIQAMALHRAGQRAQAEPLYRRAAAAHPKDGRYLFLLGLCLLEMGRREEGRRFMAETVKVAPRHAGAHYALGRLLAEAGETETAKMHLSQAVTLAPTVAEHYLELGNLLAARDDLLGAVKTYRAGLHVQAQNPGLKANLGTALYRLGDRTEALTLWNDALRQVPHMAVARLGLANDLRNRGDFAGAERELRKAVDAEPRNAQFRLTLGGTLRHASDIVGAIRELEQARALDPTLSEAACELARCYQAICAWDELEGLMPGLRAEFAKANAGQPCAITPFFALSLPVPPEERAAVARGQSKRAAQRALVEWRGAAPLTFTVAPRDRLTIGYLSSDLREHPMSHLIGYLFGAHDRTRVSVDVYAIGPDDASIYRRRIEHDADRFVDLRELNNAEAAKLIHKNGVDILIDLNGPTRLARQEITAMRPAPITATWIGFPGATGAAFYDYAIADRVVAPPADESLYGERLCRLPHTYFPNDRWPPDMGPPRSREAEGLPATGMVFCCFCVPYKIEQETFRRWMAILQSVPGSVLWLLSGASIMQERLRAAALAAGIDPVRLIFATRKPKPDHLARIGLADLMLDTMTYGGHTTVSDALLAGVPAISRLGDDFASRVGASLLTTLGLQDLIVPDLDRYERLAVTLGRDTAARDAVRSRLQSALPTCILFDPQRFAHSLERAYWEMWSLYSAGKAPRTIDLSPNEVAR